MKTIFHIFSVLFLIVLFSFSNKTNQSSAHQKVEKETIKCDNTNSTIEGFTFTVEDLKINDFSFDEFINADVKFNFNQQICVRIFSDLFSTSTNKICLLRHYIYGLPFI
ncbi:MULTISPECIES: hypothetical protein [Empedobacter]|uniref:hypothetical protein n=1 Tax=Empedobacter TaxID=59734 RepID=UPI000E912FBB|nr:MULTISPECIES: hypothetical protein [Empedobacter]HAD79426.1 hypothetical protein [Flavobacteriaceae bacterium]MDH1882835.1 hypothetical protein [Empedobacter sp. GD03797]MDM1042210.1 hypothetical protein [Empedobacter brevis]MDM1136140.1 hypothetical protein [Empedobacter sp. R750]HAR73157.1 hypothetical protein [Flavobacteriaceae bacterium]